MWNNDPNCPFKECDKITCDYMGVKPEDGVMQCPTQIYNKCQSDIQFEVEEAFNELLNMIQKHNEKEREQIMKNKYKCGICGTGHENLDDYIKCVTSCAEELKQKEEAEAKQKRIEEVNAALSKVKAVKAYYQEQLDIFKEKYPEEYRLNFFNEGVNECPYDCKGMSDDNQSDSTSTTRQLKINGKPVTRVRFHGKDVALDKPLKDLDPEAEFILKLLGIL